MTPAIAAADAIHTAVVRPALLARIARRRDLLLLSFVLVAAAYLRFHLLAQKSFWFDEGFSACAARLDWANLVHLLWVREGNMALHYVLLKCWLQLGMSEFFVRSLSVVFGLAGVVVIYALGSRLFNSRVGLIAAMLLSLNAFHVRYSQDARGYTLLVLLAALSSLAFVTCIERPTSRNWWLYTLASVLTVYSHLYGILVIAAHWLSILCLPPQHRDRAGILRSMRFFVYGVTPIIVFIWRVGGQPLNWLPKPDGPIISHFFRSLTGNGGYLLLSLYVLGWIVAAWARWTSGQVRSLETWRYDFLFLYLLFPIAAVVAGSYSRSLFLARYLIVCLPACVLLAAVGIARLHPGAVRLALLLVVAALSVQGTVAYYQRDFDITRGDWRTATRYLLANAEPGDGIFFYTAPGRMTFEYYRALAGKPLNDPEVLYPSSGTRMTYKDFLVTPLAEVLQDPPPRRKRVWVFLNEHRRGGHMDMGSEVVCAWHAQRYHLVSKHTVEDLDLLLYAENDQHTNPTPH